MDFDMCFITKLIHVLLIWTYDLKTDYFNEKLNMTSESQLISRVLVLCFAEIFRAEVIFGKLVESLKIVRSVKVRDL